MDINLSVRQVPELGYKPFKFFSADFHHEQYNILTYRVFGNIDQTSSFIDAATALWRDPAVEEQTWFF